MNEDVRRFLEKNNIDVEEVNKAIDCNLMLPRQVNPIASMPGHGYFKMVEDKFISIADIVGYDYEGRVTDPNIFHSMDSFFDSRQEYGYKARSIGLLDYSSETILEELKGSFETEPVEVDGMGNNNYVVSKNGLHRYTILRALYLNEYKKCNGDKKKIEELKHKYTIPAKVRELDELKTYSIFLLNKLDNIQRVENGHDNYLREYNDKIIVDRKDGTEIKLTRDELASFVQEEFKNYNWQRIYEEIEKYDVLKTFVSQGGLPISTLGYNNELMTIDEYENLTNQYKTVRQNTQSISNTARATYSYAQTEENKFIKLAKYLGLNYKCDGIDRTHISAIINQLENKSETMTQNMYKVTDSEKVEDIRNGVEDIEDLVSKTCETTKNTYSQELKSEFISSYEAKIQQLITGSKIEKLKAEKSAIANKRVSIIGKLLGKEKLKMAQLEKFNKKMEIQRLRTYARGFRDFSTAEEKGIMTTEMEEFIKLLESKPEFADIAKEVKGIFEGVTDQENQNTQLVLKSPKVSIRKQLKSVEQDKIQIYERTR